MGGGEVGTGTYLWNLDLVTLLEELSVLLDELLGWHILNSDTLLVVNAIQIQLQQSKRQSECFYFTIVLTSIFVLGLASCLIDDNQY